MFSKKQLIATALVIGASMPSLAQAYSLDDYSIDKNSTISSDRDWSVTAIASVGYGTVSPAVHEADFSSLPFFQATYKDFALGLDGLSYKILKNEIYTLTAGVGYDFGRDDKNLAKSAKGVGDVDGGINTRVVGTYAPIEGLKFDMGLTRSFSDAKSLLMTSGVGTDFKIDDRLSGEFGAHATWADNSHMKSYYGVNAAQAAASGLNQFKASSGIEKVIVSGGVKYAYDENINLGLTGGVNFLQGDAAKSPIVNGDENIPFFYTTVSYTF